MNALLAQALAYADRGWPVFPCRPDFPGCPEPRRCECKAPLTTHGFLDASTDATVIRGWWARWPAANVAIATGEPGPDVADVDVKPAGTGFPAFNRLKRAGLLAGALALVRTPSGGLHAYYTGTSQPCGRLPRHFLDFKAAGGYVLTAPSKVHGKPYEVIDHRSADGRIDWQAAVRLLSPARNSTSVVNRNSTPSITSLVKFVAGLGEGNRNAGLFWAACRVPGDDAALDQLVSAAVSAGLPEAEARRTVASAARRVTAR